MQRRRHERYELEVQLNFSWKDTEGVRHLANGTAHNISGGGIFISTNDPPPLRSRIRFNLSFNSFLANSRLVMDTIAEVIRVEPSPRIEEPAAFAAFLGPYTLRNDKEIIE